MADAGLTQRWVEQVNQEMLKIEALAPTGERTCYQLVATRMNEWTRRPRDDTEASTFRAATARKLGQWRNHQIPQKRNDAVVLERVLRTIQQERGVTPGALIRPEALTSIWDAAHPRSAHRGTDAKPNYAPIFETYDARGDGVYKLWDWSRARPLNHLRHIALEAGETSQTWIIADDFARARRDVQQPPLALHGKVTYVTDFTEDHAEHLGALGFKIWLADSEFGDAVAIAKCLNPSELRRLLGGDPHDVVTTMPPCRLSVAVALAVEGPSGPELLAFERGRVTSDKSVWMFGVSETMKRRPDGTLEDFYATAIRGLEEEAGLVAGDIGPLRFSYFCIICPKSVADEDADLGDRGYVVQHVLAQAACRLDKDEIIEGLKSVHSSYEHARRIWLPYDDEVLVSVVRRCCRLRYDDSATAVLESGSSKVSDVGENMEWICFGPQSAVELWRWGRVIKDDLRKLRSMVR